MTNSFASALQEYRDALTVSAKELPAENAQLHLDSLRDIEQRFAETADPSKCRLVVESARIVHTRDSFIGANGQRLREALEHLVAEISPK